MSRPDARDRGRARQVRQIAVVVVATMVLWMLLSWAGGFYRWQPRFVFLIDFLALAAFAWALIVALRLWLSRRSSVASSEPPEAAGAASSRPRKTREAGRERPARERVAWFETLGVAEDADAAEIRAAYKRRARDLRSRRDKDQMRALTVARDRGLRSARVQN